MCNCYSIIKPWLYIFVIDMFVFYFINFPRKYKTRNLFLFWRIPEHIMKTGSELHCSKYEKKHLHKFITINLQK